MSADLRIPRPPKRTGRLAWVQASLVKSMFEILLKAFFTDESKSWSKSSWRNACEDLNIYVNLGIEKEFLRRTKA